MITITTNEDNFNDKILNHILIVNLIELNFLLKHILNI
jgi:hypothetical protein